MNDPHNHNERRVTSYPARGRYDLEDFVAESNRIEGIHGVTQAEVDTTRNFLKLKQLTVPDVEALVKVYQPDAALRVRKGMDVRVGSYVAPRGGPHIKVFLEELLLKTAYIAPQPWRFHLDYEHLHPFTDGNGRSGRAIWLWMMKGKTSLGFLHHFYYQTLNAHS